MVLTRFHDPNAPCGSRSVDARTPRRERRTLEEHLLIIGGDRLYVRRKLSLYPHDLQYNEHNNQTKQQNASKSFLLPVRCATWLIKIASHRASVLRATALILCSRNTANTSKFHSSRRPPSLLDRHLFPFRSQTWHRGVQPLLMEHVHADWRIDLLCGIITDRLCKSTTIS